MEEWLQFVESSSPYLFRGCLLPELEKAWFHLQRAVMHYCRITESSLEPSMREQAASDMLLHAQLVEEVSIEVNIFRCPSLSALLGRNFPLFLLWAVYNILLTGSTGSYAVISVRWSNLKLGFVMFDFPGPSFGACCWYFMQFLPNGSA